MYTDSLTERRKRQCSSLTVSKKYEGWIELDIKLAVKQWEKPNRNMGLAVEVQDVDEEYKKALDFFHPVDCEQACKCVTCCCILILIQNLTILVDIDINRVRKNTKRNKKTILVPFIPIMSLRCKFYEIFWNMI